ncbi:MAG: phosphatidate cytidylyltransferase [Candidatus Margulisiibacteriota bacterium]
MTKRIITGLALIGVGVATTYYGGLLLFIWVAIISLLSTYELIEMHRKNQVRVQGWLAYVLVGLALGSCFYWNSAWEHPLIAILCLGLIAGYLVELFSKKVLLFKTPLLATLKIALFISGTFPFIFLLRNGNHGLLLMAFVCSCIWMLDIAALFGGRFLGKTPLSNLSPKKTIEGSVIGTLLTLVWAAGFCHYFHLAYLLYLPLAVGICVVAQCGDLHESLVKRTFRTKDSSNILPGHGGIYDRADSTLFVIPAVFYLFN